MRLSTVGGENVSYRCYLGALGCCLSGTSTASVVIKHKGLIRGEVEGEGEGKEGTGDGHDDEAAIW